MALLQRLDLVAHLTARSLASRFESGSSKRKACGWRTIARPSATRWRWPPESSFGRFFSWSARFSSVAVALTCSAIRARGTPRSFSPYDMFSATVMCG